MAVVVVKDTALAASTEVEHTMEVVSIMAVASNDCSHLQLSWLLLFLSE